MNGVGVRERHRIGHPDTPFQPRLIRIHRQNLDHSFLIQIALVGKASASKNPYTNTLLSPLTWSSWDLFSPLKCLSNIQSSRKIGLNSNHVFRIPAGRTLRMLRPQDASRVIRAGRRYVEFEEFFRNKSWSWCPIQSPPSSNFQSCFWRLAI